MRVEDGRVLYRRLRTMGWVSFEGFSVIGLHSLRNKIKSRSILYMTPSYLKIGGDGGRGSPIGGSPPSFTMKKDKSQIKIYIKMSIYISHFLCHAHPQKAEKEKENRDQS